MPGLKREQLAFLWGFSFIGAGLIIILAVLYYEALYPPTSLRAEIAVRLFGHVAITCFLLGVVGIIVEFKNWRDYFEERLASTIQKKEFLKTLERDELKSLLKDVFQAYYKVRNLVYDDSLLEFFNTRLQDFIAYPFREDLRSIITIHEPTKDECCLVEEDFSYKCRKVDVESSTIQKEIRWFTDLNDIVGELQDYKVVLQLPDRVPKNFSTPDGVVNGGITFNKGHKKFELKEGKHGFQLSIEEYKEIDELQVQIHLKYVIPNNRFFAWVMNYPTRGFQAVFHYPDKLFEIFVETFGLESANKSETRQPGIYSLSYDSWLLPDYGLSYQFRRSSGEPANTSAAQLEKPCNTEAKQKEEKTPEPKFPVT